MWLVFLLYGLFASVFTTAKTALEYSAPLFLVGSRMVVAGIILLGYQYLFKREEFQIKWKSFWRIFLLAFFAIYLTNIFEFWGLKYLTSFKTCFIYSLSPFLSALFSYFALGEKMSAKKWMGLSLGFLGFIPILLSHSFEEREAGQLWIFTSAELSVVLAAMCSVYGWILLKQIISLDKYSPIMGNGLAMVMGGGLALAHSSIVEIWDPIPVTHFYPFLGSTAILILISNLICYNLYGHLLKKYSATFMSFAGFTTPLFTAFFGWAFLGEGVTAPFYISCSIVFLGLLIFYQEELQTREVFAKAIEKESFEV